MIDEASGDNEKSWKGNDRYRSSKRTVELDEEYVAKMDLMISKGKHSVSFRMVGR